MQGLVRITLLEGSYLKRLYKRVDLRCIHITPLSDAPKFLSFQNEFMDFDRIVRILNGYDPSGIVKQFDW